VQVVRPVVDLRFASLVKDMEGAKPVFLAMSRAYHGKTAAAVHLTHNRDYSAMYQERLFDVEFLDDSRPFSLEPYMVKVKSVTLCRVAGFIFEPVQGEGGIRPADAVFLHKVVQKMRAEGVPIIADEVQTGCFRTGSCLACATIGQGVLPDCVTLGKALGGGMVKISATLIRRNMRHPDITLAQTSTFANDPVSNLVASKALQMMRSARQDIQGA
jgi:acetylornithine/succinyldiaminopimelate/putrescine aminotransferase